MHLWAWLTSRSRSKRRDWRRYLPIASLLGLGILAAGAFSLLRTPSWYAPPVIAVEDRQRVRNSLVDAEQAFTESLRLGRPFVYQLHADDVNRWIAMRGEIYPLLVELTPHELEEPIVLFDEGEITIAGRYKIGGVRVVVSLDISAIFHDEAIMLKMIGTRCGSTHVPIDPGRLGLDRRVEYGRGKLWPGSPRVSGEFVNGVSIDAQGWWKNGGIAYRVDDLKIEPGRVCITVTPLGRQSPDR